MWLWKEWPGRWGADAGIDLVAEDHDGRLWAIQAKAYDPAYSVTKADVDTFLSESARAEFSFRLLIATTDGSAARPSARSGQEKQVGRLLLGDLRAAEVDWPRSPSDLRPAQAVEPKRAAGPSARGDPDVVKGFETVGSRPADHGVRDRQDPDRAVHRRELAAERTLVLVPSLSLLKQTMREWTANDADVRVPAGVLRRDGRRSTTTRRVHTSDLGFPVTTDPHGRSPRSCDGGPDRGWCSPPTSPPQDRRGLRAWAGCPPSTW